MSESYFMYALIRCQLVHGGYILKDPASSITIYLLSSEPGAIHIYIDECTAAARRVRLLMSRTEPISIRL